jgi:hypothetical protein
MSGTAAMSTSSRTWKPPATLREHPPRYVAHYTKTKYHARAISRQAFSRNTTTGQAACATQCSLTEPINIP